MTQVVHQRTYGLAAEADTLLRVKDGALDEAVSIGCYQSESSVY